MERNEMEKYCKYCENATALSDPDKMLCSKLGVVSAAHDCRRFKYDPLKRAPKRMTKEISLEYVEV